MKAPKKIKIGGHSVDVAYFTSDDPGKEFGHYRMSDNRIGILTGLHFDQERSTVLHEVLHGICATYGCRPLLTRELEEKVILIFEAGLFQVLRDNPKLIKYLMEKEDVS